MAKSNVVLVLLVVLMLATGAYLWSNSKSNNSANSEQVLWQRMESQVNTLKTDVNALGLKGQECMKDYQMLKGEAERLASAKIPDSELLSECRKSLNPILKSMKTNLDQADVLYSQVEQQVQVVSGILQQVKARPQLYQKHEAELQELEKGLAQLPESMEAFKGELQALRSVQRDMDSMLAKGGAAGQPGSNQINAASALKVLQAAECRMLK